MEDNILYLPTEKIVANQYQPRKHFDEETLDELSKSIKNYGIIQPLSVRMVDIDKYELVAGERRLRAAKMAGLKAVPVIIVNISDTESATIALLENIQREDLNFIEEAEAYQKLLQNHGYTQEYLANSIGKKQSTIANKLRILKLDDEIRKMILENSLTERHARALLKLPNRKLQAKILNTIISKNLNVKATEDLVDKELIKLEAKDLAADGKKRIKGVFSPKVYVNTIKQVFDKFGINASYKSKDLDDYVEVTIKIQKK